MNKPPARQKAVPRALGLRAELREVKGKLKELEARVDLLHQMLADRTYRLASRVSLLERGSAYVQTRDGW